MPPVVVAQRLGAALIQELQSALLHPDLELKAAMERSHIQHYATVESQDYAGLGDLYNNSIQAGYEAISKEPINLNP
jgi:phosphonate transport system substrate-binding protein